MNDYPRIELMKDSDRETRYDMKRDVLLHVRDGMRLKLSRGELVRLMEDGQEALKVLSLGVQEPPQDYRIFNKKRADGTYPPVDDFFMKGIEDLEDGE